MVVIHVGDGAGAAVDAGDMGDGGRRGLQAYGLNLAHYYEGDVRIDINVLILGLLVKITLSKFVCG